MKNEVVRLTRFVENILNLSVMETGHIRLELAPVTLEEVIKTACRVFDAIPETKQIQINLSADLPPVLADENLLESIFNHLFDNGLKYAPGSPVVLEAFRVGNRVRVQVSDQGPGIPMAKRSLLFQRFQRLEAKDSQSVYGYGLGLYLSRRMLRAMHSDLSFEAPTQGGTRFYFYLKVAK
jgi:K+-sensing histidine kinase KdpD